MLRDEIEIRGNYIDWPRAVSYRVTAHVDVVRHVCFGKRQARVQVVVRMRWIGDSTLFETCSALHVLSQSPAPSHGVDLDLQKITDRPVSECDSPSASAPARSRNIVQVRSVSSADSTASVALTVGRGEYFHNEMYDLRRRGSGWAIRGVALSGGIQISPPFRHPR